MENTGTEMKIADRCTRFIKERFQLRMEKKKNLKRCKKGKIKGDKRRIFRLSKKKNKKKALKQANITTELHEKQRISSSN